MPSGCRFAARCDYATDECRGAPVALVESRGATVRCARVGDLVLQVSK
jgi:ABC-type dipeptide/oligopeptide/nickel transport system ATPase component